MVLQPAKPDDKHAVPPFDLVIFGGTGDLAMRKLLPSLYYQDHEQMLPAEGRIIGVGRSEMDSSTYRQLVNDKARPFISENVLDETTWQQFLQRIDYLGLDVSQAAGFEALRDMLTQHPDYPKIFYLSTGPNLFAPICKHLGEANLVTRQTRIAVEKPLGRDLASARLINDQIAAVFSEQQIFRIDHYLGKEPVQNLLALRFSNALFEPLWNRSHISDVQITVAETVGVEGRGEFYDQTGALRDMVQNHLLQVLSILAMEPPTHNAPNTVRDEKLKVLRALRPLQGDEVAANTVRAQYKGGAVDAKVVDAFLDEPGVDPNSRTETFVALRAHIDNWRWAGVPFYLRTGKRLQERVTEIVINFEPLPHAIFESTAQARAANRMVIRLQPEESVRLSIRAKRPGDDMILRPVELNLNLAETLEARQRSAYERLLVDLLRGQQTLFVRYDELEAAWHWIDPILNAWAEHDSALASYTAGTWGPSTAGRLIYETSGHWHEDS